MSLALVDQPSDSGYEKLPFLRTLCPFQRNFVQPAVPAAVELVLEPAVQLVEAVIAGKTAVFELLMLRSGEPCLEGLFQPELWRIANAARHL